MISISMLLERTGTVRQIDSYPRKRGLGPIQTTLSFVEEKASYQFE